MTKRVSRPIDPPDQATIERIVRAALAEDRAEHDVTTRALVPPGQRGRGVLRCKAAGVICGLDVAREAFAQRSAAVQPVQFEAQLADGEAVEAGAALATVEGPLRALLSAERVALNLLQRLSGVATLTRRFVEQAAAGGSASIIDTRKTTPGLRELERYAVRAGGGRNHRDTLADGVLIKDNHLAAGAKRGLGLADVVREARAGVPHTLRIEVEVTSVEEARAAIEAGADAILLDNMSASTLREAVATVRALEQRVLLEASGGVTLETVREIAGSGVDLVSVGALTHSAPALDISFEVESSELLSSESGSSELGAG